MYVTKLSKWQCLKNKVESILTCDPESGWFYKLYDMVAGDLYCTCCIFWRGFIYGAVLISLVIAAIFGVTR